jgi:phosphoglucomutase
MSTLDLSIEKKALSWINGDYDTETKDAVRSMLVNGEYDMLTDAFYKDLEFGTGGLRGLMGPGTNRVNQYTLGMATQGLSNYLNKQYPNQEISVAIAHDNRNNSEVYARVTADVFSANGIKVHFFDGLRPTPELSYAIRELGCQSGVMLTASHNPKEYNGYKAYGPDGGQLVTPHDKMVIEEVRKINDASEVNFERNESLITTLGSDIDDRYIDELVKLSVNKDAIANQSDLKIVFSPIHGTGGVSVPPILKAIGFNNVSVVEEQMVVDGNFPTVVYPNPEEHEALNMAIQKANEIGADLVMATDPDADRVGIAVRNTHGDIVLLNGNQTASLLVEYMLEAWDKAGKLTGNQYIVKTIVTSYLLDKIAAHKGVNCYNTLTGFKWIGAMMSKLEGQQTFIVGGEESYGYLVGEHARDKDAVVSCAMIAEMAAYYKDQGSSLYEALIALHRKYGLYLEKLVSIKKTGKSGAEEIKAMMQGYRDNPPAILGGSQVIMVKDYATSKAKNITTGTTEPIDLPSSNVLQFYTEDGSIVSARPSGTEPKIKFYCSVNQAISESDDYEATTARLQTKIDALMDDLMGS